MTDYGPLACLAGTWKGDKGVDRSPEPGGEESTPYFETILYEPIGDVTNAQSQTLSVLRYHQVVSRKSTGEVFHNETGYWSWDPKTGVVMHSLTIPRGVALLAGGKATVKDGTTVFEVKASLDSRDWGIVQSPFMREKAATKGFVQTVTVKGSEMSYEETTILGIYGESFDHTDRNTLKRG